MLFHPSFGAQSKIHPNADIARIFRWLSSFPALFPH
jgi:hypothetical protein